MAVAVSVDLANASATRAFEVSTTTLAGRATHAVEAVSGGLPDELFARIVRTAGPGVAAAPVVEGYGVASPAATSPPSSEVPGTSGGRASSEVTGTSGAADSGAFTEAPTEAPGTSEMLDPGASSEVPGTSGTTLRVLGIDPFSERPFRPDLAALSGSFGGSPARFVTRPRTGFLTPETATDLGVARGDRFVLRVSGVPHTIELLGLLEPADPRSREALSGLLVMDISSAQEVLGQVGRLDRIDLVRSVTAGERPSAALERVRALLPPGAEIVPAGARVSTFTEMTRAFRLNLTALSLLALVCGAFLIYNTMTFSVVQRRPLVGTLRALGVTRRELFAALLIEAAVLGVAGTALGLGLGIGLGRLLVDLVTRTINDLYLVLAVRELAIGPWVLARGALLGVGATLLAALGPAFEATSVVPRAVLARSELESGARRSVGRAAVAGALLLAAGGAALVWPWPPGRLAGPFAGLFGVILGCALLAPGATVVLMALLRRPAGLLFGVLGRMAARGVVASLSRTGVAVAALVIAVSVTVGIGVMIGSFRATLVRWLDHTLGADVYLSPAGPGGRTDEERIEPEALHRIAATPGVERLDPMRAVETAWLPSGSGEGGKVRLVALDLSGPSRERFRLKAGDPAAAFAAAARGDAVLVSEPFAYRHRLAPGDHFRLVAPEGERSVPVAGVYYDYGAERGAVLLDLGLYRRLYRDPAVSGVSAQAAPGVEPEELAARLRRVTSDVQLLDIRSQRTLRETSLAVFDRTFEITRVLRWLAGLVAFVGVLAALMALQLERSRELGVLRANGLTPGQVWQLVTSQTLLLGVSAGLLALPVGLLLATVMIRVVNRRSFGWTIEMSVAPEVLLQALVLAVGAAFLAGLYPAWKMSRTSPAVALREE